VQSLKRVLVGGLCLLLTPCGRERPQHRQFSVTTRGSQSQFVEEEIAIILLERQEG
jgi:hypothetical protein